MILRLIIGIYYYLKVQLIGNTTFVCFIFTITMRSFLYFPLALCSREYVNLYSYPEWIQVLHLNVKKCKLISWLRYLVNSQVFFDVFSNFESRPLYLKHSQLQCFLVFWTTHFNISNTSAIHCDMYVFFLFSKIVVSFQNTGNQDSPQNPARFS